ncbi:hypothetical protein BRC82_09510 [Halobacteriales archaeon QS_1_67_19]|nr:MAG: hypothetical protein BRC82_09510 [Halobacteriales archaeon QS_1_67_19]
MTEHGTAQIQDDLREVAMRRPHLRDYLKRFKQFTGEFPRLIDEPTDEWEAEKPNVIYPVGGPIYCHIYGDVGQDTEYYAVEPELSGTEQELFGKVRNQILERSVNKPAPQDEAEYDDRIEELLDETVAVNDGTGGRDLRSLSPQQILQWLKNVSYNDFKQGVGTFSTEDIVRVVKDFTNIGTYEVSEETYENIRYRLNRDIVGFGPLEPIMRDPANEDIHVIGPHETYVDHGMFGMLGTSVDFGTPEQFDNWLRNMGERIGDPVSDSDPIVDSTLPDGSRINIIYSDDVSLKGPSLTIRQGEGTPLSVAQITNWGTLSPKLAAYLWLCLENEQTVFVVGETASGKTTTLNCIMSFIPRDAKIYTAEDTAEVLPPHDTWQQLLTREGGGGDTSDVDMFDLVAAALRSRPDYIVVGEVRGEEGRMAFQAAQTGHPVMLTFHASDIVSMIQRFTGDPINIPETFMDNAVVTRQSFYWDPVEDEIVFQGMNNSYVLEEQIATLLGYENTRDIYDELDFRAEIMERMIEENILGYHEVNETIEAFQRDGVDGLPFDIHRSID